MTDSIKSVYSPELIGEKLKLPLNAIRVLREIVDASETQYSLPSLLRAHTELLAWIESVRQNYLNQASSLLDTAGAFSDVQLIHPFPELPQGLQDTYTSKAPAGFTKNQEENND